MKTRAPMAFVALFLTLGASASASSAEVAFLRGDVDRDGELTLADAVLLARAVALREDVPCADAADFTDNGRVELGDAGLLLEHLLKGRPEPGARGAVPGAGARPDAGPALLRGGGAMRVPRAVSIVHLRARDASGSSPRHARAASSLQEASA
jgi:hypothetical protein